MGNVTQIILGSKIYLKRIHVKLVQKQFNQFLSSTIYIKYTNIVMSLYVCRSIRRIIFYSLIKPVVNEDGDKEMDVISVSQALQIAGNFFFSYTLIFFSYISLSLFHTSCFSRLRQHEIKKKNVLFIDNIAF